MPFDDGHHPLNPSAAVCRVCRMPADEEEERPLLTPCLCRGTMEHVHEACLFAWLERSKSKRCEICSVQYSFSRVFALPVPHRLPLLPVARTLAGWVARWLRAALSDLRLLGPAAVVAAVTLYSAVRYFLFTTRLLLRALVVTASLLPYTRFTASFLVPLGRDFFDNFFVIVAFITIQVGALFLARSRTGFWEYVEKCGVVGAERASALWKLVSSVSLRKESVFRMVLLAFGTMVVAKYTGFPLAVLCCSTMSAAIAWRRCWPGIRDALVCDLYRPVMRLNNYGEVSQDAHVLSV